MYFEEWEMKLVIFAKFIGTFLFSKDNQISSIIKALRPWVMVAKNFFPFTTVTDGFEKINFMGFFNEIYIFHETFKEMAFKITYS